MRLETTEKESNFPTEDMYKEQIVGICLEASDCESR